MKQSAIFIPSISELASQYDAFLLDLWGVIHDGRKLYPHVKECLTQLRGQNKKIVFLSNAPRRADTVAEVLDHMGIVPDLYDAIVTSGETAYQCLAHTESSFFKPLGKHYLYIGLGKDRDILEGLGYEEEIHPEYAQFVLLAHSFYDNQPPDQILPLLQDCLAHKLPLLCINPDTEVVRQTGERVYCAGVIAEAYRKLGGEVIYFGKPHRAVYEACLRAIGQMPKQRILCIGDNILTDIKGAERTGLASALVTSGVLRETTGMPGDESYKRKSMEICTEADVMPAYIIPAFNW